VLGVAAAIGIIAGIVISQVGKRGSGKETGSKGKSGSGGTSGNSTFVKDDRLHQSFWGIAYTPQVR
jgi:hypothetical protein